MDALTQLLLQQLSGDGMAKISQKIGADDEKTGTALSAALPLLVSALANNAAKPEGAKALDQALARDHDGSILNNLSGLLENPEAAKGSAILGHILGAKQPVVTKGLSKTTGMSSDQINELLRIAAPLVMGALGKQKQIAGFDTDALSSYLGGQKQAVQQEAPTLMNTLNSLLDADKDGSAVDDILGAVGKLFDKK